MEEKDTCEIVCAHEEEVNFVKSKMLQDELLFEVSDNFKVFVILPDLKSSMHYLKENYVFVIWLQHLK